MEPIGALKEEQRQQSESRLSQNLAQETNQQAGAFHQRREQQAGPLNLQKEQQAQSNDEAQCVLPAYARVQVLDREQSVREAVQGRTLSAIVTAAVSDSDSKEMRAVKQKVMVCSDLLNKKVPVAETEFFKDQIRDLEVAYLDAIAACQYYCDHKDPVFEKGKLRKQAVSDTLELLKKEMECIPLLREMAAQNQLSVYGDPVQLMDLVEEAGTRQELEQAAKEQERGRKREEPESPAERLTYEDFAKILTTEKEDCLEFRGQSLRVVKNGLWSKPANVTSESNKKMVERFVFVATRRIEQRQELSEEQKTNLKMRIQYELQVKLLDSRAGAISMSRLRDVMQMVDHLASDTDRAIQRDRHVSPMEHSLAMAVNEGLSIPAKEVQSKEICKKLQGILEEARNEGIALPLVSDEELKNIVAGRLYTIRDEAFHNLQQIYQSMSSLKGGRAADFSALAADKKTINCLLAFSISRMTAATSAGARAADYELRAYMAHKAFVHCGDAYLEPEFMKTRIFSLAYGGKRGLFRQVTDQISRTKAWKNQTDRVLNGMNHLGELCSLMETLAAMQSKAFMEGLTQEETQKLRQVGSQLQDLVDQGEIVEDMKLVAENLKESRFARGFRQLQKLTREPHVFTASTDRIARAALIRERKQDILEESPLAKAQEEARRQAGIEDRLQQIRVEETSAILDGLQGKTREIASLLLQEKKPSEWIKKQGDEAAQSTAALYYALRSMKEGAAFADVTFAGVKFTLAKRENGDVELRMENRQIPMPFRVEFLMYRLEQDISENLEKYGDELAGHVLQDAFVQAREKETEDTSRSLFLNVLGQKTGLDAAFFRNMPVEVLSRMAEYTLLGMLDRAEAEQMVRSLEDPDQVMLNEKDTLEMIRVMEQQKKQQGDAEGAVVMPAQKQQEEEKDAWNPEEKELIELISDMVFSKDTWKTDLEQREPADRMRMLMYEHSELLAKMVKNKKLVDQTFQKLKIPGAENLTGAVNEQFQQLFAGDAMSRLKMLDVKNLTLLFRAVLGDEQDLERAQPAIRAIKNAMNLAKKMKGFFGGESKEDKEEDGFNIEELIQKQKSDMMETFREMDAGIEAQTKTQIDAIQNQINTAVEKLFDAKASGKSIEDMTLEEILEQNVKGQEGQGKFFKLVLTGYFRNASTMDQRAMIASALRNVKPEQEKENQSEEEKDKQLGAFLGGFLKGAGPLLHKILQGLPMEGMPQSLKTAIGDMKSRLSPIAPEIVEARMNKMILNSRGMITKIVVQRSLGAASIGQTFLCKLYGPNLEQNGKDVVIKLLRPDVQNRLEREKQFVLDCAAQTSEGMLKTYQGQLRAIEQELDLRIEARNAELGKVYDKGPRTVQSMKTVKLVSPDAGALVLEKAPGSTVDKYLEEVKKTYQQLKQEYTKMKAIDGGYTTICKLYKLKEELTKRQGYVAELARKWLVSGIYEEGFYHGDLHSGNIMVDENGATVIDFGNAMQITKEQQTSILHMVCAAQSQNIDGFRHHFHLLLSPESEAVYQEKKAAFNEMLGTVLFKEGDAGMRIAVALAEAQKLGLELPAAIHNFSQCQIRLKNTVDDMVTQINEMQDQFLEMFNYDAPEKTADPLALNKKYIRGNVQNRIRFENHERKRAPQSLENLIRDMLYEEEEFDEEQYKRDLEATPQNMGKVTRLHQNLQILLGLIPLLQSGAGESEETQNVLKGMGKGQLQKFVKGMEDDFQVHTPEFAQYVDRIQNWFEQPGFSLEELGRMLGEVYKVTISDEINPYLEQLGKVRKLRKEKGVNPETLEQAEEQLMEQAKRLSDFEAMSEIKRIKKGPLESNPSRRHDFEMMMKGWFEDRENYGEELRELYDRILAMRQNGEALQEDSELVQNFADLFERAMVQRAHQMEEMQRNYEREKPKVFYKVMQDVILERFKQTVWSMGLVQGFRF